MIFRRAGIGGSVTHLGQAREACRGPNSGTKLIALIATSSSKQYGYE
jgi:hypothetical protein